MKRTFFITMLLVVSMLLPCYAEDNAINIPSYVKSPEDVAKWFSHDFKYQFSIPDTPKTPSETLASKGGDCDDLATLASSVLSSLGVSSSVVAIRFKDPNEGHAVCIWKDDDGTYSFISNLELHHTGERTMDGAIKKIYPAAEEVLIDFDRRAQAKYLKF